MKVIKDMSAEVPDTNGFYFRLDDLSDPTSKDNLYNGYNAIHANFTEGDRQASLNIWMPTEFAQARDHFGNTALEYNKNATEVYGVCPHTVEWLSRIDPDTKYKYIYYPFNQKDIPDPQEKENDVCYFGGIHSEMHQECLRIMSKFKYCYMTMTHGINSLTQAYLSWATHINLSHQEKIKQVGKCKVSVCYNVVPLEDFHIKNIKGYPQWETNKAFSHVDQAIMPQFKSRMHEAAMAKTINLVYRDPWGIAEDYYTPDVDFVYFDSNRDLEEKISHIVNNWEDYEVMVESAYNKALDYTTDRMFNTIKQGEVWKPESADHAGQAT